MYNFELNHISVSSSVVQFAKFSECLLAMQCSQSEIFFNTETYFDVHMADSSHVELLLWHSGLCKYLHFAYVDVGYILDTTDFAIYDLSTNYGFWKIVIPKMIPEVKR